MVRFGLVRIDAGPDAPAISLPAHAENIERLVELHATGPRRPAIRGPLGAIRRFARALPRRAQRRAALGRIAAFAAARIGDAAPRACPLELLEVAAGYGAAELEPFDLLASDDALAHFSALHAAHAPSLPLGACARAWRRTLEPILATLRAKVPPAPVVHAVGTGTAGLLGALAARRMGARLVVTELDVDGPLDASRGSNLERGPDALARSAALARGMSLALARMVRETIYESAAEVIFASEAARARSAASGLAPKQASVVANGVDLARLAGLRARGTPPDGRETTAVALVAPIAESSDVKTFLRASKLLVERLDLVDILVVGDVRSEAHYHACLLESQMLGIDRLVRFAGPLPLTSLLCELDCLVATGLVGCDPPPLLEAMAAGVPIVATATGGTPELLEGCSPADRALGPSGILCRPGDHVAIADAVVRCIRDADLRRGLIDAGARRARRYYRRDELEARYLAIYERLASGGERAAS